MDELSTHDYNLRQYNHMDSLLDRFKGGRLPLGELVNTLYSLLFHLKTVDEVWESEFEKEWFNLDIECAMVRDREERGVAPDFSARTRIMEVVKKLKQLLAPKLLKVEEQG